MSIPDLANALCFIPYELSNNPTNISPELIKNTIDNLESAGFLIDEDQRKAITHSLSYTLTLLWGPAGTGKTDTIANYLATRILLANEIGTTNIIIGSNNYGAIDNLLAKAFKKIRLIAPEISIKFFRVKSTSSDSLSDEEIIAKEIIELTAYQKEEVQEMIEHIENPEVNCIVAGTWKQITKIASSKRVEWFDTCVIDEATQLNTVSALAYFTILTNNASVTVAGDHRQLGTIYSYDNHLEAGIYDSIFNFYRDDHKILMQKLNRTYRSNESVASWPRERFYDNVYEAHFWDKKPSYQLQISEKPKDWPNQLIWDDVFLQVIDPNNPIVVIIHDESTSTLSNHFECDLIISLNHLLKLTYAKDPQEYWNNYVGIVSPHRAQNSLIRNKLLQKNFVNQNDPLAINTVDSFQGKQRETILNSYVVSDADFIQREEEFILDSRRFNVTLTRAESKFIMIISSSLIRYLSNNYKTAEDASHLQMFAKLYCSNVIANININHSLEDGSISSVHCQVRIPS